MHSYPRSVTESSYRDVFFPRSVTESSLGDGIFFFNHHVRRRVRGGSYVIYYFVCFFVCLSA